MRKVTIETWPGEPGRKFILVNGTPWGSIHMNRHGANGATYDFAQASGGRIRLNGSHGTFSIPGDKLAKRRAQARQGAIPAPINERLLEAAEMLVNQGYLRDPEIVRREARERTLAAAQAAAQAERERSRVLTAKADELIEVIRTADRDTARAAILAAFSWAQSQ